MKNTKLIEPILREDYVSPHLKEEARKREIEPLPPETEGLSWGERLWLFIVRVITKFLRKYG